MEAKDMTVNAPAPALSGTMDVDEFMALLETRPHGERWELIEGVAVMMAASSYAHQRITYNLCSLLNNAFAVQRIDLFAYFDAGVRSPNLRNFQPQPDVVVVPGVASYDLYSERFQLVAEILSPSNTRREIDLKLRRYREVPDNLYSMVIEPREFFAEVYAKSRNGSRRFSDGPMIRSSCRNSACAAASATSTAVRRSIRTGTKADAGVAHAHAPRFTEAGVKPRAAIVGSRPPTRSSRRW
jgi:Uma2 family endonuclease